MGLLDQFTKISGQDPLQRLVDVASNALQNQLENAVSDLFEKGLKTSNFSSGVANELASRFGDSFKQGAADRYFRTSSTVLERIAEGDIFDNIFPRFAETTSTQVNRMTNKVNQLSGTADSGILQYPSHIGKYFMALKFRTYTRTAPQAPATLNFNNAVVLPIPRGLEENFNMRINTAETGMLGLALDLIQAEEAANRTGAKDFNLGEVAGEQGYAAGYMFLTRLLDDTKKNVAGQVMKAVPNPHLATFFSGIEMRSYKFEWTFAPRNKAESLTLMEIIKQLKRNALPTFSTTGQAALTYPDLCFVELYPWANDKANELMLFKPALLKEVSVNYSPNGIPSFFADSNLPTFINIRLDFAETEYFTGEDYGAERRTDGLEKVKDVIDNITDFLTDTNNDGAIQDTADETTQPATKKITNIVQGAKTTSTVKSTVDLMEPGRIPTNITTITNDKGESSKVLVGRAGPAGIFVDDNDEGSRFISANSYYIVVQQNGIDGQEVSGPFETSDSVLRGLNNAGAVK